MMWVREAFVIEELPEQKYKVFFLEHAACKNCGACKGFGGGKDKTAILPSQVELNKGDKCMVGIEQSHLLKLAFWVYLFPILALFLTIGLSLGIDKWMGWVQSPKRGFFLGFGVMIVSFITISKYFDKKFKSGEWGMRIIKKVGG